MQQVVTFGEAGASMIGTLRALNDLSHNLDDIQSDASEKMGLLQRKHEATYRHCVRVAWLSEKLAQGMNLDAATSSMLVRGCFIHDLGKLLIPNSVLDNINPLTGEQWALIRKHPEYGVELLQNQSLLGTEIVQLILHHHERWDGEGYPYGLKGERIPLLARACSVVDAFDSMLSPRPYRRKRTIEDAMLELEKHAGTQFDPELVEKFIPMAGDVGRIYFTDH
jgi:putative nucleotidyltransferase with HDIG domain